MILLAAWSKYGGTGVLARRVSDLGNIVADGFWWLEEICEESWGRNWSDLRVRRSQHFFKINIHFCSNSPTPEIPAFTMWTWSTLHGLPPDSASYSFVFQCSYIGTKLPACALSEHKPYPCLCADTHHCNGSHGPTTKSRWCLWPPKCGFQRHLRLLALWVLGVLRALWFLVLHYCPFQSDPCPHAKF